MGKASRLCRCRAGGDGRLGLAALIAVKCGSTVSNTRHFLFFRIVCCVSFSFHLTVMQNSVAIPLKYVSLCGSNVTSCGIVQGVGRLFFTVNVVAAFCFLSALAALCLFFTVGALYFGEDKGSLRRPRVFCSENR